MGKYDNIGEDKLRADLLLLATLIRKLEEEGRLLEEIPRLMKIFGDLRQKMFAYEIRSVERLIPEDQAESKQLAESRRVVREALKREQETLREWETLWSPGDDAPDAVDEEDSQD
jgi:hypothetical protein